MSTVFKPFVYFYNEFGLRSVQATGRNAYLIIAARSCRMFAYGMVALVLGRVEQRCVQLIC